MLRNAMDVLEQFSADRTEAGVTEMAGLLGRPKSSTSRLLAAMHQAGFLDRDEGSGRYRVGMRLAALGELARAATSLQQLARPRLAALAAETGETANLVVLAAGEAVNVELVESVRPVKHVGWLGRRLPLHATAAGKALVAWADAAERRRLLPRRLERYTEATVTDHAALDRELALVRRRGWARAWGELEPDLVGIAAPVRDHTGDVAAVLAISVPMGRMTRAQAAVAAHAVMAAAADLGHALGDPGSGGASGALAGRGGNMHLAVPR